MHSCVRMRSVTDMCHLRARGSSFRTEPVVCSLVNRLTKEANAKVPRIVVVSCRRGQSNSYKLGAGPEGIGTRVCAGACAAGGRV